MFFSVIVPVYNVEQYLEQCIESISSQTFTDYELILVDDCSTDGSGEMCDRYPGAAVIHKRENEGLAEARNSGLEICKGEYVIFIDSDDFLIDNLAFEKIHRRIRDTGCDVLMFGYKKYYEQKKLYRSTIVGNMRDDAELEELIRSNAYKALSWNKVTRNALLHANHMRFPKGIIGEDLIWCYELLLNAVHIAVLKDEIYAYRQRDGSIRYEKEDWKKKRNIESVLYSIKYCLYNIQVPEDSRYLLYSYLAYEFSWFLGRVSPFWNDYRSEVRALKFLLKYRLSNKVKKVWMLYRLAGLRMTSYVCSTYIRKKAAV